MRPTIGQVGWVVGGDARSSCIWRTIEDCALSVWEQRTSDWMDLRIICGLKQDTVWFGHEG
jgi:hypothetical protein